MATIIPGILDDVIVQMAQDIDVYYKLAVSIPVFARKVAIDGIHNWQRRLGYETNIKWTKLPDMLQKALSKEFDKAFYFWNLPRGQILSMGRPAKMFVSVESNKSIKYKITEISDTYKSVKTIGKCHINKLLVSHSEEISFDDIDIPTIVKIRASENFISFHIIRIYNLTDSHGTDYEIKFEVIYYRNDMSFNVYRCEVKKESKPIDGCSFGYWHEFLQWFVEIMQSCSTFNQIDIMLRAFYVDGKRKEIFAKLKNLEYTLQLHESICDRNRRSYHIYDIGYFRAFVTECTEIYLPDGSIYIGTSSGERLKLPQRLDLSTTHFIVTGSNGEIIPTPPCVISAIFGSLRQRIMDSLI